MREKDAEDISLRQGEERKAANEVPGWDERGHADTGWCNR